MIVFIYNCIRCNAVERRVLQKQPVDIRSVATEMVSSTEVHPVDPHKSSYWEAHKCAPGQLGMMKLIGADYPVDLPEKQVVNLPLHNFKKVAEPWPPKTAGKVEVEITTEERLGKDLNFLINKEE